MLSLFLHLGEQDIEDITWSCVVPHAHASTGIFCCLCIESGRVADRNQAAQTHYGGGMQSKHAATIGPSLLIWLHLLEEHQAQLIVIHLNRQQALVIDWIVAKAICNTWR